MATKSRQTSSYREVERKFEVVEETIAPSFDGLSAVAQVKRSPSQRLEAVYFDTPGLNLAARRVTLRRRTGGSDAGWHLKLPDGPDARTEVRASLGADQDPDAVPPGLREVVLAIVRDRPLQPVASIDTERTVDLLYRADGTVLAEFCDDQVTATALDGAAGSRRQWREWELELADGVTDRKVLDRLANRLLDAGAAPATHGSKLARVLDGVDASKRTTAPVDQIHRAVGKEIEQLLVWDRAVRADVDDSVHQMRVTTRKLRSLLQSSGYDSGQNAWILDELRLLAAMLGVARDAEVLAERYERALDDLPEDLVRGPIRAQLVDGAQQRYQSGLRRSLAAMRSQRYFRMLDGLETLAHDDTAAASTDASVQQAVDAAYQRVRKAAKAAAKAAEDDDRDEALHRIRKGAKRLRYTAAAAGTDKVADRAKAVQSLLGDYQDSVVSRTQLSQQAHAAHIAGADTFTYGVLHQREEDLAARCRARLDAALKKLDKAVRKAR